MILKQPFSMMIVSAFAGLVVLLGFQNCAQDYSMTTKNFDDPLLVSGVNPKYYEINLKDRTEYPDLKLFFIVDNSNTMKANQVNLKDSFQAMFSGAESKNLNPFDAQIFFISTAQTNGSQVSGDVLKKSPVQGLSPFLLPGNITFQNYLDRNRFAGPVKRDLSGALSGDILGFQSVRSQVGVVQNEVFVPAPVQKISSGLNGQVIPEISVHKIKGQSGASIAMEISERLKILDPSRNLGLNPTKKDNVTYGEFDQVIDRESGMCAMARILKRNQNLFSAGDLVSFVIVSDENEAFSKGEQCIDEKRNFQVDAQTDVVDVTCRNPTGLFSNVFNYNVITKDHFDSKVSFKAKRNGICKVDYRSGLRATYSYRSPVYSTGLQFFTRSNQCFNQRTAINYYTVADNCVSRDGIMTCEKIYSDIPVSLEVVGDYSVASGNCDAAHLADALPKNAVLDSASLPFTCEDQSRRVAVSGNTTDCEVKISASSAKQIVQGDFSVASGKCVATELTKLFPQGIFNDQTKPFSCDATVSKNYLLSANFTKDFSLAEAQALGVPGTQADTSNCPESVVDSLSTSVNLFSCQVSWNKGSQNVSYLESESCELKTPKVCTDSNGLFSNCQGVVTQKPFIETVVSDVQSTESLKCTSACSVSNFWGCKNGLSIAGVINGISQVIPDTCQVSSSVFVPEKAESRVRISPSEKTGLTCQSSCVGTATCGKSSQKTIADYFASVEKKYLVDVQEGSCKSSTPVMLTVDQKVTLSLSQIGQACALNPPVAGKSFGENVAQSAPYRLKNPVNENYFVTGGMNETPQMDLVSYIQSRSKAFFGNLPPLLSVFVKLPGESLGPAQSVGSDYLRLADAMKGKKESITNPDYSTALANLGKVIRARLDRAIIIPGMDTSMQVRQVWRKDTTGLYREKIAPEYYSSSGDTLFFREDLAVQPTDQFRIQFY